MSEGVAECCSSLGHQHRGTGFSIISNTISPQHRPSTSHLNLIKHQKHSHIPSLIIIFRVFNTKFKVSQTLSSGLSKVLQKNREKQGFELYLKYNSKVHLEMSNHLDYSSNMCGALFFTIFLVIPYK